MLGVFVACAVAGSFVCGALACSLALAGRVRARRQKELKATWQLPAAGTVRVAGLADSVLDHLRRFSMTDQGASTWPLAGAVERSGSRRAAEKLRLAGMSDVQPECLARWRIRASAVMAAVGVVAGSVLTPFAAAVGFGAGALAGWASAGWALNARIAERKKALEGHVSEAIEVMCLGLRAGLTFERALDLYCTHFPTRLSAEFEAARQVWSTGLLTRQDALHNLSAGYDSIVFERVVDCIVRSMRFGSPLADSLEDLAKEARRSHRAQVEEAVMKTPVKMMLPIGLLILPSMMLLVMGPIVLELIQGL